MLDNLTEEQKKEWGLDDIVYLSLRSNDYGWTKPMELPKPYILKDIRELKGRVTFRHLIWMFKGTGHSEWETIMALTVLSPMIEAYLSGKDEADISALFNRDLLASRDRVFTADQCLKHVSRWFNVFESDNLVELRFKYEME